MRIDDLTFQARMDYARQALHHPTTIMGSTVEKFMEMPMEEILEIACDLEYIHQHYKLASLWLVVAIMMRENYNMNEINKIAYLNNIAGLAGYYPRHFFNINVGMLIRALGFGCVDKSLYATIDHYKSIDKFFGEKSIETRDALLQMGLTPKIVMKNSIALRWVPGYLRKILTQICNLKNTILENDEFTILKAAIQQYFETAKNAIENSLQEDEKINEQADTD
jgi:hypothetical protein